MKRLTMVKKNDISLSDLFDKFIKKCKVKNLSDYSIKFYQSGYRMFTQFIDEDTQLEEITANTIDNYILYLRENSKANGITINSYLRGIRAVLYYGMKNEYLEQFTIHTPKVEKKIKETYTDTELKILLKKPNLKTCKFIEYRTWVFSNYLLATGNRISSAANLIISDLDFENELIHISKTKNRKAQIIPMSKTLSGILQEYLSYRGGEPDDYVFCNQYGEKATSNCYAEALADYNHARGVMKTSAHLFRHTFAKNWIMNGGDIFRLQKILGHSDLTVVKEYVNMFGNDLSIDFDKFNPLDKLGMNQQKKKLKMKKK